MPTPPSSSRPPSRPRRCGRSRRLHRRMARGDRSTSVRATRPYVPLSPPRRRLARHAGASDPPCEWPRRGASPSGLPAASDPQCEAAGAHGGAGAARGERDHGGGGGADDTRRVSDRRTGVFISVYLGTYKFGRNGSRFGPFLCYRVVAVPVRTKGITPGTPITAHVSISH